MTPDEKRRGLPITFKPFVDEKSVSQPKSFAESRKIIAGNLQNDAILTESPIRLMQKDVIDVPMMMGYTSHEGLIMLPDAYKKLETYDKDLARMIPRSVDVANDSPNGNAITQQLANEIRQFYFKGKPVTNQTLAELADLQTDYHFGLGTHLHDSTHGRANRGSIIASCNFGR